MPILRTGVDLIEVARVVSAIHRHGERLLRRVFTAQELVDCGHNVKSLAARFAAKEAVAKALGTGIGTVGFQEIEIQRGSLGEPVLCLHGCAQTKAHSLGLRHWAISLSHSDNHAIAMVVASDLGG
jgi:holo-[acyl-carrier protein] synthase